MYRMPNLHANLCILLYRRLRAGNPLPKLLSHSVKTSLGPKIEIDVEIFLIFMLKSYGFKKYFPNHFAQEWMTVFTDMTNLSVEKLLNSEELLFRKPILRPLE